MFFVGLWKNLVHTKLRNRLAINKLHKLAFVHYNMRLRVRNLTYKSDTDDYYNPINLNNIFNDDILDEWIREGEQPILPLDDLDWVDEGIHHSDESGGDGGNDDDGNDGDGGGDDDGGYRADGDNDEET